jgi:hypothetical protein
MPKHDDVETGVETVARVHMSPELTKALLGLMKQLLDAYESNIGEIPVRDATVGNDDEAGE